MDAGLRTAIVVDYQNVHLTGHGLFGSTRLQPAHTTLVDPLVFANELLRVRNLRQKTGALPAVLDCVLVYRGHPSPEHDPNGYARNLSQKSRWERDPRVRVTLRPLKYEYQRDATGRVITEAHGKKVPIGKPQRRASTCCAPSPPFEPPEIRRSVW